MREIYPDATQAQIDQRVYERLQSALSPFPQAIPLVLPLDLSMHRVHRLNQTTNEIAAFLQEHGL